MFRRWNVIVGCGLLISAATAKDGPDWDRLADPATVEFYTGLMQPDQQDRSCCGYADAYFADSVEVNGGGQLVAIITDTRDDIPRNRRHIPPGTKFVVPSEKIRKPPSANPTGHNVIFIGAQGHVYCWEPASLS